MSDVGGQSTDFWGSYECWEKNNYASIDPKPCDVLNCEDDPQMNFRIENDTMKTRIQDLLGQISSLKLEVAKLQARNDLLNIQCEHKSHELKEAINGISTLLDGANELKQLYNDTVKKLDLLKIEYERKVNELNERILHVGNELRLTLAHKVSDTEKYTREIRNAEHKIALLNAQLENRVKNVPIHEKSKYDDIEDDHNNDSRTNSVSSNKELDCIYAQLKDQIVYIKSLEEKISKLSSTNQRLKTEARNCLLLEEKCKSLENDLVLVRRLRHEDLNLVGEARAAKSSRKLEMCLMALGSYKDSDEVTLDEFFASIEEERVKYAKIVEHKNYIDVQMKIKELEVEFLNNEEKYEAVKYDLLKTKKLAGMLLSEAKPVALLHSPYWITDNNTESKPEELSSNNNKTDNVTKLVLTLWEEVDTFTSHIIENPTQKPHPVQLYSTPFKELQIETKKHLNDFMEKNQKLLGEALTERNDAKMEAAKLRSKLSELESKLAIIGTTELSSNI